MMNELPYPMDHKRITRHILFWLAWVFGFTFIKSFGMSIAIYSGWFIYYIVTLPLFVSHTYLIVYWLIPAFLQKRRYVGFSVFFLLLFYLFSVLELVISYELVFKYFSSGSEIPESYLGFGNVLINGLGNFYIILVFMAARSIRIWNIGEEKKKKTARDKLALQVDKAISKVQPKLLIYAVNYIEKLAEKSPEKATRAIALTSEILNEVMIYNGQRYQVIEKEVALIKKLVDLITIFKDTKPDVEFFLSGDPSRIQFPSLILFSFVEMIFRQFDQTEIPELNIEISGFSDMATIQVLIEKPEKTGDEIYGCEELLKHFEQIYPDLISISFDHTPYGCSIVIKRLEETLNARESAIQTGV